MATPCAVIVFILVEIMLGSCKEASEETQKEALGNENEQRFDSIPTLFEYLLELLEKKPEILEKNDVTFFQDVSQEICKSDVKREIKKCDKLLDIDAPNRNTFKRNVVLNYLAPTNDKDATGVSKVNKKIPEIVTGNDHDLDEGPKKIPAGLLKEKRDAEFSTELPGSDNTLMTEMTVTGMPIEITTFEPVIITTPNFPFISGIPDVSNGIEPIIPRKYRIDRSVLNSKDLSSLITTEVPNSGEDNIIGLVNPRDEPIGLHNGPQIDTSNGFKDVIPKMKTNINDKRKKNKKDQKHKRDVNVDSFVGPIDWSKFYLSPEQVEEQALQTEQAIEDHNKKKEK